MKKNNLLKKYIFLNDENNEIIQNIDFSQTSVFNVVNIINNSQFSSEIQNKDLHDYIFQFYAYNEILASLREKQNGIISKEDLKIFKDYGDFSNDFSKRIFSFILYACLSEARHCHFFEKTENEYDNFLKSMYKLQNYVIEKELNNFELGKKTKIFNSFLINLKQD